MGLKRKITKDVFDKLPEQLQSHYVQDDDDEDTYTLDIDGFDDPGPLRRARDRERNDRKKIEKENEELKRKLSELERNRSPKDKEKSDDVAKIDSEWKEKHEKELGERDAKLSSKDQYIRKTLINTHANALAKEISTVPTLMATHIRERLDVDFSGDEPELIVKGKDGDPITMDQLKKELTKTPEFAHILVGNKATGSGAPVKPSLKDDKGGAPAPLTTPETDLVRGSVSDLMTHMTRVKEAKGDK